VEIGEEKVMYFGDINQGRILDNAEKSSERERGVGQGWKREMGKCCHKNCLCNPLVKGHVQNIFWVIYQQKKHILGSVDQQDLSINSVLDKVPIGNAMARDSKIQKLKSHQNESYAGIISLIPILVFGMFKLR
jgi:hypothetical protein